MSHKCYVGLGSNAPTASAILSAQTDLRKLFPGIRFSQLVRTAPVGIESDHWFLNQVAFFVTSLSSDELIALLKKLETVHGRKPHHKALGLVVVDLDLLCYDGRVLKPGDWARTYVRDGVEELSAP